ncbi:MAG: type II toxin-antitoxin system RelE/ParE family toxin [Candidatus Omnitrophica bacterium]|nr:type II toxin-antitoxin system RelE/ParE family toxin [Candidatus Omnitrophota bacterium]
MAAIVRRPQVLWDLEDTAVHLAEDSERIAERFLNAAQETFEEILSFPKIGRSRNTKCADAEGLRSLPIKGFPN